MDHLRKPFKSHGSYKHNPSSRGPSVDFDHQEEQPILFDREDPSPYDPLDPRREVVVKIDGNSSRQFEGPLPTAPAPGAPLWRGSSYDFWRDDARTGGAPGVGGAAFSFMPQQTASPPSRRRSSMEISGDLPSRLISPAFVQRDMAGSGEVSLGMDVAMEELKRPAAEAAPPQATLPVANSRDLRVSFQDPSAESIDRRGSYNGSSTSSCDSDDRSGGSAGVGAGEGEVLKCSSNSSFRRTSSLLRTKTRSRLMDPPPLQASTPAPGEIDWRAAPSGKVARSGPLGQPPCDEDDDDPFVDEDVPAYRRRARFNTLTLLEWISLVLIVAALTCSLFIPSLELQTVWNLHLWKWEVLVLVLICGRLVSGWGIHVVVFFFERNFLLRKRVLYFVYGLRSAVQNCLWLGLVLIAWYYIFDEKVQRDAKDGPLSYITKVLLCLLVAALMRLVKTLLVKVLASSFHVSTYFDRIQESLLNQYVIETLSGPPLIEEEQVMAEVQKFRDAGAAMPSELRAAALPCKSARVIGVGTKSLRRSSTVGKSKRFAGAVSRKDFGRQQDEGITINHLHKLNHKNVSAWNMKRLMNIVRHGALSTLDEQIPAAGPEDESARQIRSEHEAKVAARRIFTNVAKPGSKHIYLVDLMRFMREEEALKTMSLFEGAQENNRISRKSLKNWVVDAFRERRALSLTLNDTKTAVNKLHQMVNIVVAIIVFVIWLLILGVATTHFLVALSSQLLLVVFIFGNTCKTTFEAIIFLFVMHPFDVGDRCEVDGVQMIVEEMNILTTVFLRYDNQKITYPNSELAAKPISNFYRSPDMGDSIDFCIHVATPVEKVAIMKERIKAFIEGKKEHWYPGPSVVLRDVEDMNRLKVSVWLQHRMNHQNMGERHLRRELVVQEMIKVFRELDIEYRMLPLEVNVTDVPSSSSRLPSTWTRCG